MIRDDLLEASHRIGTHIAAQALWDGERCTWFGPVPAEWQGRPTAGYASLGPDLYAGTSGIALALAEIGVATGDLRLKAAAAAAAHHAGATVGRIGPPAVAGFHAGLGGIAVALALCGRLLDDDRLVHTAAELWRRLLTATWHRSRIDLIGGKAGAVLAGLILSEVTGDAAQSSDAIGVARRIVTEATKAAVGICWPQPTGTASTSTGLSHGSAGISHALVEAYRASGDPTFADAATATLAFEDSRFDPLSGTWNDDRARRNDGSDHSKAVAFWCHGSAGIALARSHARTWLPDLDLAPVHAAADATVRWVTGALGAPNEGFSLCHGLAGNAEVLFDCSRDLGRCDLRDLALEVARFGTERYLRTGRPWPCHIFGGEPFGLMLGLAGIARFYLRASEAVALPSVLLPVAAASASGSSSPRSSRS